MTEENVKSLMKKTKKELIDIIARKDDTEKNNVNVIKELQENVATLSDKIEAANEDIATAKSCIAHYEEIIKCRDIDDTKAADQMDALLGEYNTAIKTRNVCIAIAVMAVVCMIMACL